MTAPPDAADRFLPARNAPAPGPGELHLWRIRLRGEPLLVAARARLLSLYEQHRMHRYRFPHLRDAFALRHGAMRSILGAYLQVEPSTLELTAQPGGKPELGPVTGQPPLQFNLSDSGDWALLAVTCDARVGVDIEQLRPLADMEEVARDHFSSAEVAALRDIAPAETLAAFFRCWTRKEAWLKATGRGLTVPLDSFDVTLAAGEAPRLLRVANAPAEAERWWMHGCDPAVGYVGTVVREGAASCIRAFEYE